MESNILNNRPRFSAGGRLAQKEIKIKGHSCTKIELEVPAGEFRRTFRSAEGLQTME